MASPPLAAAASGGEASSGPEAEGPAAPGRDLAALFEQAAARLPALVPAASKEQLLYLYARYKQVKFGTCNTPKPSFFDFEGKQKWEAWKALGDSSPHQAMQEYIATVKKLDPSWTPEALTVQRQEQGRTSLSQQRCTNLSSTELISRGAWAETPEKRGKECKTAFGGPVVSSLYQEETIREEDKNIFDYCRENNIDHVTKAIRSNNVDVNVADEEGRALLHWACDRGHKELVSVLLQHAADVNSQVSGFALQISTLLIMCSCLILSSSLDRIKAEFPRTGKARLHSIMLPPASFSISWSCC
uniref:Acyl-CoA-binding domain-containing protein 6 n=1 Tax=Apteryx owenii TaxID=8824 RepID=A0A8B9QLY7_APTOW